MFFNKFLIILKREKDPVRFMLTRAISLFTSNIFKFQYDKGYFYLSKSALSHSLYMNRNSRKSDLRILLDNINLENAIVIDAGANIGHLSVLISKHRPDSQIYAFEPHPVTYRNMVKNIRLNDCKNIIPLNFALSDKLGVVRFTDNYSDDQNRISIDGSIECVSLKLDNFVEDFGRVDLLKIDVEGFEWFVCNGARKMLDNVAVIFFEVWYKHLAETNTSWLMMYELLSEKGFQLCSENGDYLDDSSTFPVCMNVLAVKNE